MQKINSIPGAARYAADAADTQFTISGRLAARLKINHRGRCGVEYKSFDVVRGYITPVCRPTSAAERRALQRAYRIPLLIKD